MEIVKWSLLLVVLVGLHGLVVAVLEVAVSVVVVLVVVVLVLVAQQTQLPTTTALVVRIQRELTSYPY